MRLGFEDAVVAPSPPRFRKIPDETVKAPAFCQVITTFSAVTTDALWLVPSSTNALTYSLWQSGEICQVLSTEAFTSFCHANDGIMGSSLPRHHCLLPPHIAENVQTVFPSCAPACPRGSLLDASHRSCLLLPPGFLGTPEAGICATMCLVISDSLRGTSLQGMWTCEGPVFFVILFFTHCATYLLSHSQFSIIKSGYARRRSKSTTSWCSWCDPHGLVENDSHVLP